MTDGQLLIAAGFPTAAGLASIAVALILNGRLESRMDRMAADLSQFSMILGRHDKALENFEKK